VVVFTMFTNNTVIPGLTRDLLNTRSAHTVFNWQIPGQARDDNSEGKSWTVLTHSIYTD
ncbi:MAG: hypothetical protein JWP12_2721, partial [Bacteroidetes bacterium]|nr:hypothetical protein [Bacteroidota bacterium]